MAGREPSRRAAENYYREVTARGGSMTEPRVANQLWETEIRDPDGWSLAYESPTDVAEDTLLSEIEARLRRIVSHRIEDPNLG